MTAEQPADQPKSLEQFEQDTRTQEELRAALRRSQAATARAKAKSEDLIVAVYQAAKDAMLAQGPPRPVSPPKLVSGRGRPEVAFLHTTDWQNGKVTDTYNMAKCAERIERLWEKVALLTRIQRTEHPVDSIVVGFGGDMLEGLNIFPGQAYEVEAPLYEQLFATAKLEEELLRALLAEFSQVYVIGEPGNHGRIGRRGEWPASDNTDRMSYKITRDRFADEKRLIWQDDTKSFYQPITIGSYHAMLIHGDEIKSFGGNTPSFGLLRKGTAWSSGVVDEITGGGDIYFGHFHTPMMLTLPNGAKMYGTGSPESDNAYAAEFVAARGKPSQRLHFVDPRRGRVTCEYQVYLGDDD